ncbi:MAG: response regulator, partial [Candidatus Korarchaeota archaeon]|nr:response regulator [Candidatus Korarchaeota archaeon]NIU81932.1 response regulator [Candidatus Thorarchaeota archaeon]NIW12390.1 response regulator [Candidatus Thorarchaeota archaeon]NIW51182.1 response regulator [Candidatus Korarchaeota archaeon]
MDKKILIIDDDKEIRRSTSEVLEKEGYSVQVAPSIDGAWETLQQWHPDLLLSDILLPSGKLKRFVKKVDDMEAINILYLSAFKESEADQLG